MSRSVWKFALKPQGRQTVRMSLGAVVLSVGLQFDELQLWALVDPTAEPVDREFFVSGTGHSVADEAGRFIGTVQLHGGALIFHVFEKGVGC